MTYSSLVNKESFGVMVAYDLVFSSLASWTIFRTSVNAALTLSTFFNEAFVFRFPEEPFDMFQCFGTSGDLFKLILDILESFQYGLHRLEQLGLA
jgi:hypothetical protein